MHGEILKLAIRSAEVGDIKCRDQSATRLIPIHLQILLLAHLEALSANLHLLEGSDRVERVLLVCNSHLKEHKEVQISRARSLTHNENASLTLRVLLPLM